MLKAAVREHGMARIEDVEMAVLEMDGSISIVPRSDTAPDTQVESAHPDRCDVRSPHAVAGADGMDATAGADPNRSKPAGGVSVTAQQRHRPEHS